jgi:hypothetical protein
MKKFKLSLIAVLILLTLSPFQSQASEVTPSVITPKHNTESASANALLNRLDEINAMDKTTLSRSEKKQLRFEVRTIKKELKTNGDGVYLSVGAIIIIVLLLILLL